LVNLLSHRKVKIIDKRKEMEKKKVRVNYKLFVKAIIEKSGRIWCVTKITVN